jgi:hypothetical protein
VQREVCGGLHRQQSVTDGSAIVGEVTLTAHGLKARLYHLVCGGFQAVAFKTVKNLFADQISGTLPRPSFEAPLSRSGVIAEFGRTNCPF